MIITLQVVEEKVAQIARESPFRFYDSIALDLAIACTVVHEREALGHIIASTTQT